MQKPDVDQIDGLSPAVSIEQKTTSKNPRSTVATVTEINDYMRLLWARAGVPYSPATGLPIESQTVSQMVDRVLTLDEGTRLYLLAPVVRGRKGEYRKELAEYLKKGFQRVKIDGTFHDSPKRRCSTRSFRTTSTWWWTASSCVPIFAQRLAESFETAQRTRRPTPASFTPIRELVMPALPESPSARGYEPGRFSFNVKGGRCEACQGDGVIKCIEMHFLPDVYVTCDACRSASATTSETLEVLFKGKVHRRRVRYMTVEEAAEFFKAVPRVRETFKTLHRVGLDSLDVGQQATTLSGGEAQRGQPRSSPSAQRGARSTSSTSRRRGCTSTTSKSCSRCCTNWSTRARVLR